MADQDQSTPEIGADLVLRANGEVALRETDGTEIVLRPTGEVRERNADSSESVLRPNGEIAARDADDARTDEVVVALMRASDRLGAARAQLRDEGEYLQQLADYVIGEVTRRAAAVENRSAGN